MEGSDTSADERLARRLRELRAGQGWSLDDLAKRSGVSRATLSRLENAAVSPTAHVLGRLCAAYDMPMSRLMVMVEDNYEPLVDRAAQAVWRDPKIGFRRRSVSPPARPLAGEVLECELDAATHIAYARPPRQGLEHHLLMLDGRLEVAVGGERHDLRPGDCLRYRLFGPSAFTTPKRSGARYVLFIV